PGETASTAAGETGQHPGPAGFGRRQRRLDPWREPRGHQQLRQRRPGPARPHPERTARPDPRPAPGQRPPGRQPRALPAGSRRTQGVRTKMRSVHSARLRFLLAATVLPGLSGCSILDSKQTDPITIYAPQPQAAADPSWPTVAWQLSVSKPTAPRLVDSPRIAVRPAPGESQADQGASWSQPSG